MARGGSTTHPTRIYVVRHAKARGREEYLGRDSLRPLSGAGRKQAQALVAGLSRPGADLVLSSPAVRCVQTVEPAAAALGLAVEERRWLAEGTSGSKALEMLLTAAADLAGLVVCTHGDVIWGLLDQLLEDGVELDASSVAQKASTWELTVSDHAVSTAHYRAPPS